MKLFHPLGFMLASPVETVEEALQRFSNEVAEEAKSASPEVQPNEPLIKEAQLEDKYDGIRAQIHCGSPEQPGRVALFSRSREDMTASFPEIVEAFAGFEEPLVLDGEILAWSRGNEASPDGSVWRTVRCLSLLCKRGWDASGLRRRCAKPLRWSLWLLICFTPTAK